MTKHEEDILRLQLSIAIEVLEGFARPMSNVSMTVAKLDERVCEIAKEALDEIKNHIN
jgi:hypothetical protein